MTSYERRSIFRCLMLLGLTAILFDSRQTTLTSFVFFLEHRPSRCNVVHVRVLVYPVTFFSIFAALILFRRIKLRLYKKSIVYKYNKKRGKENYKEELYGFICLLLLLLSLSTAWCARRAARPMMEGLGQPGARRAVVHKAVK